MKKYTHITLIGLNFFPESTAIGLYSTQLAQYLEEQEIQLDVITAFPYYPQWEIASEYQDKKKYIQEQFGSINVYRYKQYVPSKPTFVKRILHIIDFTWGSFWNLWKIKKCDIVISIVPFTSATLLGYIHKRRFNAKSWIHIQDFEFDAAFQSGLTKSGEEKEGVVYRLLMWIEKSLFSKADRISTISHTMIKKLEKKTTSPTYYLPNWIDENQINPAFAKAHPHVSTSKFKILYSGNIGDKQDWVFFMKFVEAIDFEHYEIIIVGDGSKRTWLENEIVVYPSIKLHPPVPYEELSDLLCSADAHILFQKPEVVDTVMPSKILGMMASSKPSIITGHPKSEVAKAITISEGGYYSSDTKIDTVIKQLETLSQNTDIAKEMGSKARAYVISHFAKDQILSRFFETLKQL